MRRMLGFFKHKNLNIYTNQIQQGPLSQKNSIHTGAQPGRTIFPWRSYPQSGQTIQVTLDIQQFYPACLCSNYTKETQLSLV